MSGATSWAGMMVVALALPMAAQSAAPGVVYRQEVRAAAELERSAPVPEQRTPPAARSGSSNAPLIGAMVGAVALPVILYLVINHVYDSDSGRVQVGTMLPIAAVGAFLGLMIGLHVKG